MRRAPSLTLLLSSFVALAACAGRTDGPQVTEIRIPRGAGGVGFLPLLMMEKNKLVEKHAAEAGLPNLQVRWIELGGPSAMNDALLSGAVDFIAAGPPAFLVLWDRTRDSAKVTGVAPGCLSPIRRLGHRFTTLMSRLFFPGRSASLISRKVSLCWKARSPS